MKKLCTLLASFVFLACQSLAQPNIQLVNFATGFDRPVDIAHCGDDRLFIVEQDGIIWILDENGNKLPTPFLNIDPRVGSSGNEQGLLGLAFHPDYASNGYFYVNYTNTSGDTRISRFSVSANDPNVADPDSEFNLIAVDQPFSNHNGGCVKFGPDGYLYIGLGDGGSGGDPQGNGQKMTTMLGKMLRIDVDNGDPYGIPADNPFVNDPIALDEIWAFGLRNPWRFSFDRATGDLWIGDVGQDAWEEIDFQPASSTGGENYGWRCYEGAHLFPSGGCTLPSYVQPVAEFQHGGNTGCSITGGFVYRGCAYPELYGHYLYTDYCTGIIWSVVPDGAGGWTNTELANLANNQFVSFGENRNGELFLAGLGNGIIYRVTETTSSFGYTASVEGVACPSNENGSIALTFSGLSGNLQIDWSNGMSGLEINNLAAGSYSVTITGGNGCVINDEFEINADQSLTSEVNDASCPGDADGSIIVGLMGNTDPFSVLWEDGSTSAERSNLPAGDYFVTVTGDGGCTLTSSFTVETQFDAPATPNITVTMDTVLSADPGFASYQWLLDGEPINGADDQSYTAQETGEYSVLVTNNDGCEAVSATVSITVLSIFDATGIEQISVSPNPFENTLTVKLRSSQTLSLGVRLTDGKGAEIFSTKASTSVFEKTFDMATLPAGTYFLTIKTEKGEWVEKLVRK